MKNWTFLQNRRKAIKEIEPIIAINKEIDTEKTIINGAWIIVENEELKNEIKNKKIKSKILNQKIYESENYWIKEIKEIKYRQLNMYNKKFYTIEELI